MKVIEGIPQGITPGATVAVDQFPVKGDKGFLIVFWKAS